MATILPQNDKLSSVDSGNFTTNWDWKGEYISSLNQSQDGYERFSQYSASPDTTILFAGPARFSGLAGATASLLPIGLVDGIGFQANPSLSRLYEIGSNRAFFTRGKTAQGLSFSKMLADQNNILAALTANSYNMTGLVNDNNQNSPGSINPATGQTNIMMNLDSELFAVPFGVLVVFKTRGGTTDTGNGKMLASVYLEYCMFNSYNFSVSSSVPVIMENISLEFDRTVPVEFA